jgi:hypothetical protein
MTEAQKARILKALIHRIRSARQFCHVDRPTTFQEVGNFRLAAQRFILQYGEDWEFWRFDNSWYEAFLIPPQNGRIDKADDLDGDVGMCHPGLARLALKTLISVMRRFEGQTLTAPPPQSGTERAVAATIGVGTVINGPAAPPVSNWGEVEIRFLSGDQIEINAGGHSERLNYAEFGCEDRRNGLPSTAWVMLRLLADQRGTLPRAEGKPRIKLQKSMQAIRKLLRNHISLTDDSIPYVEGQGYQARFRVSKAPSYDR